MRSALPAELRSPASVELAATVRRRAWRATLQRLVLVTLILAIGTAIALPRVAMAILPQFADQGLYVTIGEVLGRGGVVGRDTWDNKPPGTYYLYAALLKLSPDYSQTCTLDRGPALVAHFQFSCAQIVLSIFDALYAAALTAAVWWLAGRWFGPAAGAIAALLCAIFSGMIAVVHGGGIPDFHMLLPATLAYGAALRFAESGRGRWLVLAGALAGLSMVFKQTGAVLLGGIALWLLVEAGLHLRSRSLASSSSPLPMARWSTARAGGLLGLGAAAVLGAVGLVLAAIGALPDVVEQALLFNRFYVASPGNVNSLFSQIRTQTWNVFNDSQSPLWLAALGALPLLPEALRRDRRVWLLLAWVAASIASLLAGGSHLLVYYYLALIPPFAVCGGWAVVTLWRASGALSRIWLVAAAATLLAYASESQMHLYENVLYSRLLSTTHTPDEFVAGSIKGGDGTLFLWGNNDQVYALSGRRPASRYLHTLALSHDFAVHDRVGPNRAELMATLEAAPPAVIVVDTPWLKRANTMEFPELRAFIARDYELSNSPSNPIFEGWEVYHRR
jgi:hypothetical protein